MRTTTTAWAAALAIMSMRGPFTTAEAAPARQRDAERQRHFFPKHMRRGGYNHTSPAIESTSSTLVEPELSSADSSTSEPPITPEAPPPTNTRRTRSSTQSSQSYDEEALIESLIEAGRLPETTNAVVTTTLTLAYDAERTATYTLTYTESSSPVPSQYPQYPHASSPSSIPLTSSLSIPAPERSVPAADTHHRQKHGHDTATISTRGTSTGFNPLASLVPSAPIPLNAGSSHPRIDSRTYRHHNTTESAPPISSAPPVIPSSVAPSAPAPTSSDDAGLLGLTNSLLPDGTQHRKPQEAPQPSESSAPTPPQSSEGLLGHLLPSESAEPVPIPHVHGTNHLLPSSGGIIPPHQPKPTPASQSYVPIQSAAPSSDGGLLLGLSSAIPNILGTDRSQDASPTKTRGLLSDLGITGVPTGVSLPAQSVLPTGGLSLGGKKKPSSDSSSEDTGLLGLTDSLTRIAGTATGLVGTLTDGVNTDLSKATGLVGTATGLVGTATGLVGTATGLVGTATGLVGSATGLVGTVTDGVNTIKSQVTPDLTGLVSSAKQGLSHLAGTATGLVGSIAPTTDVTGLVGTATGLVGTATNVVGTATGLVGTATGLVGTATGLVGTATGLVGTATQVVGTLTNGINTLTNTLPVTTPTGGYTITGGGVTLTVPIPTSIGTSIPITVPSQVTTPTQVTAPAGSSSPGYTITVPTGASSVLSSLSSANPTETAETVPESASSYPASVPLTGNTKLTLTPSGSASSYASKETSAVPAASSSSLAPETHTKAPQTIKPTATDSATSMTFPSSWKFAPTTWSTKTTGLSTATAGTDTAVTGLPTYMPRLVQPPDGMPSPPVNSTLIQLGFNYGLNYPFVVGEPDSAGQIFAYLPQGLAHGLGISEDSVKMNALMPYDTSGSLTYITTLAQAYIPSSLVDTLEMSIHMPLSDIYHSPDSPVKTLMSMINPTIPILPGAAMEGASSASWYNPAATSTKGPGAGAPLGGDSGSANHVKPSTVGIGIGALGGAAVYAAAMVYVARRYRQKRQNHKRASSVQSVGEMSQRSGGMADFFMSGGAGTGSGGRGSGVSAGSSNGRSVREQGISHPIMAENSLGWN